MIRRISLVICLFTILSFSFSQSDAHIIGQKTGETAGVSELLQTHKKFIEVTAKGDADGMGALVSDDYSITGVDGQKADRAKALDAVRQNSGVVVMEETDVIARLIDGAGIVTGLINWKAGTGEREVKGKVRFTEVWRKVSSGWRLVVAQATNVKD